MDTSGVSIKSNCNSIDIQPAWRCQTMKVYMVGLGPCLLDPELVIHRSKGGRRGIFTNDFPGLS